MANVRVPKAFGIVHGKFTFLSGEICASRDRRFMREIPETVAGPIIEKEENRE
jgi:hypothetical protein